ncbi:MAG: T9SS type A sorting domain-containing protein [Bacteroidetes bacterium]|nr:T9SS type A sorting domain-containing protein [Bacteroidota bacterium]
MANKFLLTPDSTFFVGSQHLQVPGKIGFAGQPSFSPNGSKFAYVSGNGIGGFWTMFIQLFDFDRCAGNFILDTLINYSDVNGNVGFGMSFSPNSKYLYFSTTEHIYKVNTDTSNIGATFQVVAVNDTFLSSPPNIYTNFYLMYLAANGKIYTSSTSSVLHLHEMNYPDSSGLACDMQLHNIYTGHFFIGVPNHPNYYLGRLVGSPCDSLTSINDPPEHDFRFKVFPNPVMDGNIKIMYLLPQNKSGKLEIYDVTGKVVYSQNLPPWSTMQAIALPNLADGIYNVVVKSAVEWESKKIIVFKE